MVKSLEDLKRHLIVICDIQFSKFDFSLKDIIKRFSRIIFLTQYCYGYIDCWCSLNDKRELIDELRCFIDNYIMDSINLSHDEVKD